MSLSEAIKNHNLKVFCDLFNQVVDVNAKEESYGNTLLHLATQNGSKEIVEVLLNAKADVNMTNNAGLTALQCALDQKNLDLIRALIDAGSDVDSASTRGKTALHLICNRVRDIPQAEEVAWVEYLLSRGANVHLKDHEGFTALHCAAFQAKGDHGTLKTLVEAGASVHEKTNSGWTALHWAGFENNVPMIEYLLSRGASAEAVDGKKQTPLHKACSPLNLDAGAIRLLVKNSDSIDILDQDGRTPLMILVGHVLRSHEVNTLKDLLKDQWEKTLEFLLESTDFSNGGSKGYNILRMISKERGHRYYNEKENPLKEKCARIFLKHLAKLHALNLPIKKNILDVVSSDSDHNRYYKQCQEELLRAKQTKLLNSWITYFDLLVDSRLKLKNYAGNEELINDFRTSDHLIGFPIYGYSMKKKVDKGVKTRELFDESSILLSDCWPIFGPSHLVIRAVLDCFNTKSLIKFCE